MKINLKQIPDSGLELEETLNPKDLNLDTENIRFNHPIKISAAIRRSSNTVMVNTHVETERTVSCSRCLKDFALKLSKDLAFSYPVSNNNSTIDISEDVRQELILDLPIRTLCQDDCLGFCPKCGKNLNEGKCNC
jgi:uncharacterized protein